MNWVFKLFLFVNWLWNEKFWIELRNCKVEAPCPLNYTLCPIRLYTDIIASFGKELCQEKLGLYLIQTLDHETWTCLPGSICRFQFIFLGNNKNVQVKNFQSLYKTSSSCYKSMQKMNYADAKINWKEHCRNKTPRPRIAFQLSCSPCFGPRHL